MSKKQTDSISARLNGLNEQELRRLLIQQLTTQKLGLVWERDVIARDEAVNADIVLPEYAEELSCRGSVQSGDPYQNLIIEGDNFDSLRLLRTTHANKIRVIYIDPPYNTGNKDWVYNDSFVGINDRWRHSQWLEFLYRRLELARDLLTPDGVIMVSINDENRSRLEMLMDEVFPGRRVGSLVWRTKDTGNDLNQRFSHVHEHVLIYGNAGFKFNGRATDRSKFRNPDNDPRGDWSPQPLTANKTLIERKNTYYPIQNPETGYWYPCDPDSTWRFASEKEIRQRFGDNEAAIQAALDGLRRDTIEALIEQKLIYFPPCKATDVMLYPTRASLSAAIAAGKGPMLPKKKTPLLRENLPDIEFWVGKPIATGRPSRKELWTARPEADRLAPLSSWIAGQNETVADFEDGDGDALTVLRSDRGGVATEEIKNILDSKAFSHPKPLSLIQGLLSQATRPGDIVLDFFAGSGTTGHAVLELNAADGGNRRFIMCSNAEASAAEPTKNICRDVTAERIRRVSEGFGKTKGLGRDFAYLKVSKIAPEDARMDFTPEQAFHLLSLRTSLSVKPFEPGPVKVIHSNDELAIAYLPEVNAAAIKALIALPQNRIAVYSARPETVAEKLEASGKEGNSYPVGDVILSGQAGNMTSTLGVEE